MREVGLEGMKLINDYWVMRQTIHETLWLKEMEGKLLDPG